MMTELWIRAEQRANEDRVGITPQGAASLLAKGFYVTIEDSKTRTIDIEEYRQAGCVIAAEYSWPEAPKDAIILGLKELHEDDTPLYHRHIMFGHAFKRQHSGRALLRRFKSGGGQLYDLEYLVDEMGRRVAAFGYWAGYAGAAVSIKCWIDQQNGQYCGPVSAFKNKDALLKALATDLVALKRPLPTAIVIGALGRVGTGAADLCSALGIAVTRWDMAETDHGGPFLEILEHDVFFNCIMAQPGTPIFVSPENMATPRRLCVIGDIACDPDSDYNPIPIYGAATSWDSPAKRVSKTPPLDVMAIDNLPSLLPLESSLDFASQLLPWLLELDKLDQGVWQRAADVFKENIVEV
jgi:saccharopine dehydrogenase (NAD+, L-lysine forming)